jgi:hypothetical protein
VRLGLRRAPRQLKKQPRSSGSGHAIRYRAYDGVSPAHAVFYDAPSVSSVSFSAEVFTSAEDQAMLAKLGNHVERSMEQLFDSGSCPEPPKYVAAAYIEPAAGGIEEFHGACFRWAWTLLIGRSAWYNEEHLDHVKVRKARALGKAGLTRMAGHPRLAALPAL